MAYLHKITFYEAKNSTVPMEHLVYGLLGAWYQSGQTLTFPSEIHRIPDNLQ